MQDPAASRRCYDGGAAARKARGAAGTCAGVNFESRRNFRPAKPLAVSALGALTLRGVASRLGRLLWHTRVLGAGQPPTQKPYSLLQRAALLALWGRVGRLAGEGWGARFEGSLADLEEAEDEMRGRLAD